MSMTSSLKIAEDCLKPTGSEENLSGGTQPQPYEGVQKFAQTIDSGLKTMYMLCLHYVFVYLILWYIHVQINLCYY